MRPARADLAERLGDGIAAPFARRTARLERLAHHLALALGGRPGAGLAARLLLPMGRDTLLRTLRRRAGRLHGTPVVIGIDDWAWKRGQRYGTVICDLQRRRIVDLLPDREPATLEAWLAAHPEIAIVARDRGGGYGQAGPGPPDCCRSPTRWHLMRTQRRLPDAVRRLWPRSGADGTAVIDPARLNLPTDQQTAPGARAANPPSGAREGWCDIKAIVRLTGCGRKTVRQVLRGERSDVFRAGRARSSPVRLSTETGVPGAATVPSSWRRLRKMFSQEFCGSSASGPRVVGAASDLRRGRSSGRPPRGDWRA